MRHAIVVALALSSSACVSRQITNTAAPPAAVTSDSARRVSTRDSAMSKLLLSDSSIYNDMRRMVAWIDMSLKDIGRGVFADSALHVKLCEPNRKGEDWRKVCVPKDQRVRVP